MNVTREVIADLWALSQAGEASADSRSLIEEFFAQDRQFERTLKDGQCAPDLNISPPAMPPDQEMRILDQLKVKLRGSRLLRFAAIVFTGLAFARIISDTSWDVSPRRFIIQSLIAAVFWIAYLVKLNRDRSGFLREK